MLSTRSPTLIRRVLTNFDTLFNISNMLTASLCLSASFGFDERAAAFLLVPFPIFVLITLGDATVSDLDFKLRPYMFPYIILWVVSGTWCQGIRSSGAYCTAILLYCYTAILHY